MKIHDILAILSLITAIVSCISVFCMDGMTDRKIRELQDEIDKIIKN